MAAPRTSTAAAGGDAFNTALREAHSLANDVGPGWGIAIIVALCLFMPRFGVIVHLASLLKEDRIDARKQRVESERLLTRYKNRSQAPVKKEGQ